MNQIELETTASQAKIHWSVARDEHRGAWLALAGATTITGLFLGAYGLALLPVAVLPALCVVGVVSAWRESYVAHRRYVRAVSDLRRFEDAQWQRIADRCVARGAFGQNGAWSNHPKDAA